MSKSNKRIHFMILAAGLCLAVVLSLLPLDGSATVSAVQDMRGVWDGFIQTAGEPPVPIRTEITGQENRRFTGIVAWGEPHVIEGTVSASGKVNYQGQSADSRIVGKYDLLDFGGGAAILNGSLTRSSKDGRFIVPCVLVMRSFAAEPSGTVVPNPAGRYDGTLGSGDGTTGRITMVLGSPSDPVRPESFDGSLEIVLNGQTHTFQLLGTVNSSGRIIAIAHKAAAGHLILDAVLQAPPDPVQPATLNGGFTLEFGDGSELEGFFQTVLTRPNVS
ncbi:MAG: hypothetical protein M3367_10060 [Acidobacteriota bacterium]|nr:hypothetical protein [Acidobacteriota bacterium]